MENSFNSAPSIIIVDDDSMVRRSVIYTLESFGLLCRGHGSVDSYLKSGDLETTSCLILDVNFPTMGGLELQRLIAERGHSFPIIFYSGDSQPAIEQQARLAGAADFVSKAAPPTQLVEAINRAISARSR